MTTLREAAQQALEALDGGGDSWQRVGPAIDALKAALAEPTVKESLQVESAFAENATTQQQLEEAPPSDYRRGYWDGFAIGKREGRIEAEDALAEPQEPDSPERRCGGPGCDMKCCQPVQEPVAWIEHEWAGTGLRKLHFEKRDPTVRDEVVNPVWTPLYTAPPQRPAEPVAYSVGRTLHWHEGKGVNDAQLYLAPPQRKPVAWDGRCMLGHCNSPAGCENSGECRAVERAHKIGGEE